MHDTHPFLEELGCTRNTHICIVSISLIGIVTFIVVPFCIYCTYQFYYYRRDQGIILRYPVTLTVSSILNILYMFVVIQYMMIDEGISDKISLWIAPIITNPYLLGIILINIFRLWLINYDTNHKIIQTRSTWQSLLCSTRCDDEWYANNRYTWGNWRWLLKILLFIWLFLSILCITPLFLNHTLSLNVYEKTADITYTSTIILLLLFAVGIWYKMPHFEDTFHILKEIKVLITSSVILCIIWFSLIFWSEEGNIFNIIQIFIIFLFVFIQIFVSEFMVMQMIRKINAHQGRKGSKHGSLVLRNTTLFHIIIATDIGIEQYFQHVQKEFSHENLLFFIEVMQWIYAVTDQQWENHDIGPLSEASLQYTFAKVIPMSSINSDASADWYNRLLQLHNKYVCEGSKFQCNFPDHLRKEYARLIRLYQMKKEIEAGVFVPKRIKKKNTQREVSVTKSIKHRLFSMRRNRSAQRRPIPPSIDEQKASTDGVVAHIRYSKSMQAYDTKTKLKQVTFVPRTDTAPPARVPRAASTALHNAMSADDANKISPDSMTGFDSGSGPSQPPDIQLNNYSVTITNMDETERKSIVLVSAIPTMDIPMEDNEYEHGAKGQETMDLEDIYMGVISDDTLTEDEERVVPTDDPPTATKMKSVSFANVDSDRSAATDTVANAGSDTENEVNEQTVIHRGGEPTLVSIMSSIPSITESEHGTIEQDIESAAEMDKHNALTGTQSFETIIETDINGTQSTLQLDATKPKLTDIEEEEKGGAATPVLDPPLLAHNDSKLSEFIDDVNEHINATKNAAKKGGHGATALDREEYMALDTKKTTGRMDSDRSAITMATSEFEYSVRRNLSRKKRQRASVMTQFIGKAWSSIFTPRSVTTQHLSSFVDDEEAQSHFVIDPVVQKEMEIAKTINVNQFVTVSCFALEQVLNLSRQSVSRFKNSKYFQAFDDNVNLEQLVKEFER